MDFPKLPFDEDLLPTTEGAFLVGGSVRDLLADRLSNDYDIAVSQNPDKFARGLAGRVGGSLVRLGKADQALFRVVRPDLTFDITAVRGPSIEADLKERDFTVNAMACALSSKTLIDPLGGKGDLAEKTLRMVSKTVFEKDPVRLVRAFRICADAGLHMEPETADRIRMDSQRIRQSPPERVSLELLRIFDTRCAFDAVSRMALSGLLFEIVPELKATAGCFQNRHHAFDVLQHTLVALSRLERLQGDLETAFLKNGPRIREAVDEKSFAQLKWAMLLHDIGKPAVKTVDAKGEVHFIGHEKKSALMADAVCRRLRLSNAFRKDTVFVVRNHIRPLFLYLACRRADVSSRAKARFFSRFGDRTPALLLHAVADIEGKNNTPDPRNEAFLGFVRTLFKDYFEERRSLENAPPFLTGFDLIDEFTLAPSPAFKKILRRVREAQLSCEIRDRNAALQLARQLIRRIRPPTASETGPQADRHR